MTSMVFRRGAENLTHLIGFLFFYSLPQAREIKRWEMISKYDLSRFYRASRKSRTDHFQHVGSSGTNVSPEMIVQVDDLVLNRSVCSWAKRCTNTQRDMYTHTHLKPMGKQQIKDIMKSDVYSGGFIATI